MSQPGDGLALVVGAVILHGGRAYVQRRSPAQALFPGSWDMAGGHVEEGETIEEALDLPRLDATEHVEWRWIDGAELELLIDRRDPVGKAVHDIVELALRG